MGEVCQLVSSHPDMKSSQEWQRHQQLSFWLSTNLKIKPVQILHQMEQHIVVVKLLGKLCRQLSLGLLGVRPIEHCLHGDKVFRCFICRLQGEGSGRVGVTRCGKVRGSWSHTLSAFLAPPSVVLKTCRESRKALTSSCGLFGEDRNNGISVHLRTLNTPHSRPNRKPP